MSAVKRTKDGIDILEHAMQGVQTSENRGRIVRFHAERGPSGMRSRAEVRALDTTQEERVVVVRMPPLPHRRRRR